MPHKDRIDAYLISVGERQPAQQVCIAENSFAVFAWSASRRSVPDFAASSSPIFLVVPKYDGIPWESAPEITDPQNYTGDCVRISEREKD
jgi:hypothetical protein